MINYFKMKMLFLTLLAGMFLSISCDKSDEIIICAPSYLPEKYQFCLNDSVDLIQREGAKYLDQGTYKVTDNDIYIIDLKNAFPFCYSEFEVKNGKIVAMSFRTVAIEDQGDREDVWNRYKEYTSIFFGGHHQEAKIPERLSKRIEKSIVWRFGDGITIEMKSHLSREGISEGISLDISAVPALK